MCGTLGRREFLAGTAAAFTVLSTGARVSSQANGKLALGLIGCWGDGVML